MTMLMLPRDPECLQPRGGHDRVELHIVAMADQFPGQVGYMEATAGGDGDAHAQVFTPNSATWPADR